MDPAPVAAPVATAPAPKVKAPTKAALAQAAPRRSPRPVIQAKLLVGPADDPYEREADVIAREVVSRLAAEPEGRRRADGVPTQTRIARMPGAASPVANQVASRSRISRMRQPIGLDGGDIDADTEREITSARSGGKPLGGKVRRRMESTMGADFSSVRVHTGPGSDALNERLSAKAFTTGADIFVRTADFRPDTPDGTKLLAHELTHTIQQGASPQVARTVDPAAETIAGSIQRTTNVIQRWEWWDKRQAAKKKAVEEAAAKKAASSPNQAGTNQPDAPIPSNQVGPNSAPSNAPTSNVPNDTWQGRGGRLKNTTEEIIKPTASLAAAGGAAVGVGKGVGNMNFAGGVGNMVLSPLLMGDAALGLNAAREMGNEGTKFGDAGMSKLAGRKAKDQSQAMGSAAIGATKAGVDIANVSAGTAGQLGHVALGAASGGLGVAVGSAMVLQGAWRGGQAVMKLCRLTWGRGHEMLSREGDRWKEAVVSAEKFKIATNALKIAVGALGIAAGALLIVSNPIGWAVGIAAGIAGGIYAITKIVGRVSNAKDKEKVRNKIEAGIPAERVMSSGEVDSSPAKPAAAPAKKKREEKGTGFKQEDAGPKTNEAKKRQEAIAKANEVSRIASANARVADEMRQALSKGNKDLVFKALEIKAMEGDEPETVGIWATRVPSEMPDMIKAPEDRKLHDAFQILSSINVDPDHALSDSGQDVIEQKLSKAESM